jgi:hypothetical protein
MREYQDPAEAIQAALDATDAPAPPEELTIDEQIEAANARGDYARAIQLEMMRAEEGR